MALLIGVADDKSIVGIEVDRLENDDKFMLHLAQCVRNGLGDRAGTCIDPRIQMAGGKAICVVACQRSPEPAFLNGKGRRRILMAAPSRLPEACSHRLTGERSLWMRSAICP